MRRVVPIAVASCLLAATLAAAQQPARCPELNASSFKTWDQFAAWYRTYPACDDGETSETFSWFITHKLATELQSLRELANFLAKEPSLRGFFLSHVGGHSSASDQRKLRLRASKSCPKRYAALCKDILTALDRSDELLDQATRDSLQMGDYWTDKERGAPMP